MVFDLGRRWVTPTFLNIVLLRFVIPMPLYTCRMEWKQLTQ